MAERSSEDERGRLKELEEEEEEDGKVGEEVLILC